MSITSANSIFMLGVASVFPNPVQLQGYSADDIFSHTPLKAAETSMGVDGLLSGGFVFVEVEQMIQLQADSLSNDLFDQWYTAQQTARELFTASATIILPAIGKKYNGTRGFLTTYPVMPDGGKTLKPRKYGITWQSMLPAAA